MLRIAICDDQLVELKMLRQQVEHYEALRRCGPFKIEWFTSSAELIRRLREGAQYELLLLDMVMPNYNGVDVGRTARAAGLDCAIIYITATAEFALDAISVHPEQYLLKPLEPKALYQALDDVRRRLEDQNGPSFYVKTREGVELVNAESIVCVEHAGRIMRVYCADGNTLESVSLRAPFETLTEAVLRQPDFMQTHKSYLVNLHHIRALRGTIFEMDTGLVVPISRRNAADVRQRYQEYRDSMV